MPLNPYFKLMNHLHLHRISFKHYIANSTFANIQLFFVLS